MYILKDWADNRLTALDGTVIEFKTFDEGWEYIHQNYQDKDFEDLFIIPIEED